MSDEKIIDRDVVEKVAKLARLSLSDAEAELLTQEMGEILFYVKKLEEINTKEVSPTTHPISLSPNHRLDQSRKGLEHEQSLENAPERLNNGFGVPKIIE